MVSMRCLALLLLLAVLAAVHQAKDIPATDDDDDDPPGLINCGELSKTWKGGLCIKHGTCNKPCREEGYDAGYCATWPFLQSCCCTKNCPGHAAAAARHRASYQCGE